MGEYDSSSQEPVRFLSRNLFKAFQERLVNPFCAEFSNQLPSKLTMHSTPVHVDYLCVVDWLDLAIFSNFAGHVVWVDSLLGLVLDFWQRRLRGSFYAARRSHDDDWKPAGGFSVFSQNVTQRDRRSRQEMRKSEWQRH